MTIDKTLRELKTEMIELMEELHGRAYTYGYVKAAWLEPAPTEELERQTIQQEIDTLKLEKARLAAPPASTILRKDL